MSVIKKFMPANFNDLLCLIGIFIIAAIWILQGFHKIDMPSEIIGGTLVTWTLLFQFYFRKSKEEKASGS